MSLPGNPHRDPEVLRRLYIDSSHSLETCGKILNTSASTISKWINKHDIEHATDDKKYKDKCWLRKQVKAGRTQSNIAEECNVTQRAIGYYMSKYDIEAANAKPSTDQEYLMDYKQVAEILGRAPTVEEYKEHGKYTEEPFYSRFGSWQNTAREAGYEPVKLYNISDTEILKDVQRVADKIGRGPTTAEYKELGTFGVNTVLTRYNTWPAVMDIAQVEYQLPPGVDATPENILNDLNRVSEKLGKTPSQPEYDEHGVYSKSTVYRTFTGWNNAIRKASLEVNQEHPGAYASDKEILSDVKDVLAEHGASVPAHIYDETSKFSWQTVTRRFGSWPRAVKKAGYKLTRGYWDEERDIYWHSYWEYKIANMLDDIDCNWERQVRFSFDCNYDADFVIGDSHILEVKGRVDYGDGALQEKPLAMLIESGWGVVVVGSEEAKEKLPHTTFLSYPPTVEALTNEIRD